MVKEKKGEIKRRGEKKKRKRKRKMVLFPAGGSPSLNLSFVSQMLNFRFTEAANSSFSSLFFSFFSFFSSLSFFSFLFSFFFLPFLSSCFSGASAPGTKIDVTTSPTLKVAERRSVGSSDARSSRTKDC